MQVPTVQPLPGVEDLYSLLAFLTDPDAVEKRLDEMERVRDEINGMIEKVGKAADIDRLLVQAAVDREVAGKELEQARAQVRQERAAMEKALSEKDLAHATARDQADADHQKRLGEVNSMARLNAIEAERLSKLEQSLKDREMKARQAMNEAADLKAEYDGKLAKLKAAGVV